MSDDYQPGTMDVSAKLVTYRGFLKGVRYVAFSFAVIISFLLITFCGGGFVAALVVAIIELGVGYWFERWRRESPVEGATPAGDRPERTGADRAAAPANRNTQDQHAA